MIKIELQAETAEEMARQIRTLLTMGVHLPNLKTVQETLKPVPESEFVQGPVESFTPDSNWVKADPKPARKVAKAKPAPPPEPEPEVVDDIEDILPEEEPVEPNLKDALALNKLKEETLGRLKDMFVAGKGKYIRDLLKKHGHGAMVFPEVEAKHFPAIKAEIDREMGMH